MATIFKEFEIAASPEFVWAAIRDVGAVHTRLAKGFVTDTTLADGVRTVTFANGFVVSEKIVTIDDERRRLAYTSVGGKASHHNAYFQVFATATGTRLQWVTDLLPDDAREPISQMVEAGSTAIRETLEQAYSANT